MGLGHLLFGFSGRINRAKYWLGGLILFFIIVATAAVLTVLLSAPTMRNSIVIQVAPLLLFFFLLYATCAITMKRLHDRDKTGWWSFFFVVAPTVLLLTGGSTAERANTLMGASEFAMWIAASISCLLATVVIGVWAFIELGCLRGTSGENRFGHDPLAPRLDVTDGTPVTRGA